MYIKLPFATAGTCGLSMTRSSMGSSPTRQDNLSSSARGTR